MRKNCLMAAIVLLAACTAPSEPEVFTSSVDVDESSVALVLEALDGLTDNDIDVDSLLELARTTAMDDEKQQRFEVSYDGEDTSILFHVWREQEDWVHLYASSESEGLVNAIGPSPDVISRPRSVE